MKIRDNVNEIIDYVKNNEQEFSKVEILVQMRYVKAVLTNRAGSAPNKMSKGKIIKETCLMPYTDIFIFPDGRMGLCCCDNFENTTLGDLNKQNIKDAWEGEAYKNARELMKNGRQNHPFCKLCDFIDAGTRMDMVNDVINCRPLRGARQSMFAKKK